MSWIRNSPGKLTEQRTFRAFVVSGRRMLAESIDRIMRDLINQGPRTSDAIERALAAGATYESAQLVPAVAAAFAEEQQLLQKLNMISDPDTYEDRAAFAQAWWDQDWKRAFRYGNRFLTTLGCSTVLSLTSDARLYWSFTSPYAGPPSAERVRRIEESVKVSPEFRRGEPGQRSASNNALRWLSGNWRTS